MFISADQILAHGIGDYVLQSDWMASEKTKKNVAAFAHVFTYTLCFIPLASTWTNFGWAPSTWIPSAIAWQALLFVMGTHFIIDRWRLARYVVWVKNFLAPLVECTNCGHWGGESHEKHWKSSNPPWDQCSLTGYPADKPPFMTIWLMIIADNLMHFICNGFALKYLV